MKKMTLVEVVLLDTEKVPDALLALNETWKYFAGSIYVIAQTTLARALTVDEEALLTRLQTEGAILEGRSRTRTTGTKVGNLELPEWAEP